MNKSWIVATTNQGKFYEIENFFKGRVSLISLFEKKVEPCEEPFITFLENALFKARHYSKITNSPVIADDSGLVVKALSGEPGVNSAKFSGCQNNLARDEANNLKLLKYMSSFTKIQERNAFFVSVVVGIDNHYDPCPAIGIGTWYGQILNKPTGNQGHGYDPIFYCTVAKKSAAQMNIEEKQMYSHRGKALKNILPQLIEKKI